MKPTHEQLIQVADKLALEGAAHGSATKGVAQGLADGFRAFFGMAKAAPSADEGGGEGAEGDDDEDEDDEDSASDAGAEPGAGDAPDGEGGGDMPDDLAKGSLIEVDDELYQDATPILIDLVKGQRKNERALRQLRKENADLRGLLVSMVSGPVAELAKAQVEIHGMLSGQPAPSKLGAAPGVHDVLRRHGVDGTGAGQLSKAQLSKALQRRVITDAQLTSYQRRGVFVDDATANETIVNQITAL